jgi:hypothetical protein
MPRYSTATLQRKSKVPQTSPKIPPIKIKKTSRIIRNRRFLLVERLAEAIRLFNAGKIKKFASVSELRRWIIPAPEAREIKASPRGTAYLTNRFVEKTLAQDKRLHEIAKQLVKSGETQGYWTRSPRPTGLAFSRSEKAKMTANAVSIISARLNELERLVARGQIAPFKNLKGVAIWLSRHPVKTEYAKFFTDRIAPLDSEFVVRILKKQKTLAQALKKVYKK